MTIQTAHRFGMGPRGKPPGGNVLILVAGQAEERVAGGEPDQAEAGNGRGILGDRMALKLMFDNLVDNAIRYAGNARVLQIRAHKEGSAARIEVSDRGIGIPAHELGQVTRRFYRGRRAGSGGSGLGLSIAARIIDDHRGVLAISSVVDAGTTVTLTLPLADTTP